LQESVVRNILVFTTGMPLLMHLARNKEFRGNF
jgi:hypothetical protein